MCLHPPLAGPAPLSAPLRAACGSPKRALKHSWPAPGLSASASNGVHKACLDHPRPRLLTASPHLVVRLIAFELGRLGGKLHPLMANRLAQTGSSSSGLAVQPVFGRKQLPWSARLADHFCCAQQAQCTLLSGPMGPVQMTSVPRRVAVLGPCVWTALTKMYLNHTGPRGSAVRLNSELQSGWLAVETV